MWHYYACIKLKIINIFFNIKKFLSESKIRRLANYQKSISDYRNFLCFLYANFFKFSTIWDCIRFIARKIWKILDVLDYRLQVQNLAYSSSLDQVFKIIRGKLINKVIWVHFTSTSCTGKFICHHLAF